MKNKLKYLIKEFILFIIGGLLYYGIEVLWRGHSDFTMVIVGGICFVLIGGLNNWFTFEMGLIEQSLISSIIVTIIEYISGYILNIKLNLGIWEYSQIPFNLNGQICLLYSSLWILLSLIAIIVDDYIRYLIFHDKKPKYKII